MSDDIGILIFLAVGVLVLAAIVFFGVRSSAKKKRADRPTWQVSTQWIVGQPVIVSSDIELADRRQEELFRQTYDIGGIVAGVLVPGPDGTPTPTDLRVSRVSRSLRAGWPQAKLGLAVYFEPWEQAEFPASYPISGSAKSVRLELDANGVTASDAASAMTWAAPWSSIRVSNGNDIILADGENRRVQFSVPAEHAELEEVLTKYATMQQMHF
ncbi:hypothetical protein [Leucobacter musarum]|uniref:hypothetical protein n=1 Tax=Leucobacter musarum TaxID=1930747 RepID=UPI0006A7C092|nr:hypothetical protein [Leucobacter musarum]